MKTGRQEVESNRRFYKHAFTNRIRASIQWDKSEKHTPGVQNTQPTPTCEWSQHVRQCEILRIICCVCMWVPVYVRKTHLCLQKRFRQSNTTVYSEVLSHVCVWEKETRICKQERQKREIQVNDVTAKPARWELPTIWVGWVLDRGDADWLSWNYGYCCYSSIKVVTQNCRETTAEKWWSKQQLQNICLRGEVFMFI